MHVFSMHFLELLQDISFKAVIQEDCIWFVWIKPDRCALAIREPGGAWRWYRGHPCLSDAFRELCHRNSAPTCHSAPAPAPTPAASGQQQTTNIWDMSQCWLDCWEWVNWFLRSFGGQKVYDKSMIYWFTQTVRARELDFNQTRKVLSSLVPVGKNKSASSWPIDRILGTSCNNGHWTISVEEGAARVFGLFLK